MASIRCKACGKTYDYRKEGFCPKCGAYNRPPRQEWVDAEGTVHYAGQEKECYERKECHEEKVCYEEQTRRPKPYIRQHVPKKGIIGAVIAVIIVIMAINLPRYTALNFGSLVGGKEELTPNYPDYGWEQEAPAEEIESTAREYAELGAVFTLGEDEDDFTTVNDVWMDDNDRLHVIVTQEETYQSFPNLCSMDSDGNENWLWLEDIKDTDKGEYTFECVYDLSYAPHDNMWLVFYGVDREVWMGIEPTI
jgi:hypothetical protein